MSYDTPPTCSHQQMNFPPQSFEYDFSFFSLFFLRILGSCIKPKNCESTKQRNNVRVRILGPPHTEFPFSSSAHRILQLTVRRRTTARSGSPRSAPFRTSLPSQKPAAKPNECSQQKFSAGRRAHISTSNKKYVITVTPVLLEHKRRHFEKHLTDMENE